MWGFDHVLGNELPQEPDWGDLASRYREEVESEPVPQLSMSERAHLPIEDLVTNQQSEAPLLSFSLAEATQFLIAPGVAPGEDPGDPQHSRVAGVIVIAKRDGSSPAASLNRLEFYTTTGFAAARLETSEMGTLEYYEGAYDEGQQTITVDTASPLTPTQQAAVDELAKVIAQIGEALANLSPDTLITSSSGHSMRAGDLQKLWAKADFVVSDIDFGLNRAGSADFNGGNPIFSVNATQLANYNANGPGGMFFYALHELAHVTAIGRASGDDSWRDYQMLTVDSQESANDYTTSQMFIQNEQFANAWARDFASTLGASIGNFQPTYGYGSW